MKEIMKIFLVSVLLILSTGAGVIVTDHLAYADPKPGLWQEAVTQADGVTVRVVRDTTGGNFNVCYVASRTLDKTPASTNPAAIAVAISCVPERKP